MAYAPYPTTYTREPTQCSSGARPGARVLQDWACDESPWGADLWDVGIFACRDVYGGWCPNCNHSALSAHASGRAGDSGHNTVNGASHPSGIAFANWLVANHAVLGIQEVICNRRRWTKATGWRAYRGRSPHIDHVHWTLNESGARYLTLARILSVAPKPPTPPAPPAPLEDDMAFIAQRKGTSTGIFLFEETRRTKILAGDLPAFTKRFGAVVPVSKSGWDLLVKGRQLIQ